MQLTSIIVTAILALNVAAAPSIAAVSGLESRTDPGSCSGGKQWSCKSRDCECPKNQVWKGNMCGYPDMGKPDCPSGYDAYCSSSATNFDTWGPGKKQCQNDGRCATWCAKKEKAKDTCNDKYKPQPNTCPDLSKYNCNTGNCECPKGMKLGSKNTCEWPKMAKPNCLWGMKEKCGKSRAENCDYDDGSNSLCDDDNTKMTYCTMPGIPMMTLLQSLFAF